MKENNNKENLKKTFKTTLNILLAIIGSLCLLGSIALFTPSIEYDSITSSYHEVREIDGGIFFGIIALVCLFFPIKLMIKTIKNKNITKEKEQKIKGYYKNFK